MSLTLHADKTLNDYRWTHRILVLDVSHPEAMDALEVELTTRMADIEERKLMVLVVLPSTLKVYGSASETDHATELRQQLIARLEGHRAFLVGFDGGLKAHYSKGQFSFNHVFDHIDAMPMRRAELRWR